MQIITISLFFALSGCFINDPDGDGKVGKADCDPNSAAACDEIVIDDSGDTDTDTDSDTDSDTDTDTDTDTDVDTGDTAEPCTEFTWFRDADGDGFGNPAVVTENCEPSPDGYVADGTDCDDADASSFPGAPESCDGADNDCDGAVDENVSSVWYVDDDGDGFGSGSGIDVICDGSSDSLVDNADDCDDGSASVNPAAVEICDGRDNDCDGAVSSDELDDDGDGLNECGGDDCDDADATVGPGLPELCNGADDDCDGLTPADELDDDADGYNECADADCDDASAGNYPGATETCDGADNDCDGIVDENDASDVGTWYLDADADGYGDASASITYCSAPAGYVADATDCDDTVAEVHPGAIEMCDEVDNDCEGTIDEAAHDESVWGADVDGDGFGSDTYADWLASCDQPAGYVENFDDCDDASAAINPDASEVSDDLADNDCNGTIDDSAITCWPDGDGDGYGDSSGGVYVESGVCDPGYVDHDSDCDDTNSTTNPAEDDPYGDGVDSDCDGSAT